MSEERENACAQADALMDVFGFKRVVGDRKLLVLAAMAAGIKIVDCGCLYEEWPFKYAEGQGRRGHWNPLTDDGDALRLAVKLELVFEYRRQANSCFVYHYATSLEVVQSTREYDTAAACRRAIVRAAARIGGNMK